jgi:hypothetical protein
MSDHVIEKIRKAAEADLKVFARLVNPNRVYGAVHDELFDWWQRPGRMDNQLTLLPRDHQKSHCAAVKAAWVLTKDPTKTLLYVSATSDLAEKQLYAIKNMLDNEVYRRYWPELINSEEGKRETWSQTEIAVDHPLRKAEGVRDPSIKAAGLTTNITGFHATDVYLDDVVVPGNAYTEEGRRKVAAMYSQLASIETTGATETVVGTRYHPKDLYDTLLEMEEDIFDDNGEMIGTERVYEVFERVVEEEGVFLWPRERRKDGKFFGFDQKELARKRAKYVDRTQFYAQYYNDPNDSSLDRVDRSTFQYYERKHVLYEDGAWYYKDNRLNVVAAVDFAYSTSKRADYTAVIVIGVDSENNVYVLEIDRFKTDKIRDYYDSILKLHNKWYFRKIRAEATAAQAAIVEELKLQYIRPNGLALSIDTYKPTRHEGTKQERVDSILLPRYENGSIFHYKGGHCHTLEEEVVQANPAHDDVKDVLASAIDVAVAPTRRARRDRSSRSQLQAHGRFGGLGAAH